MMTVNQLKEKIRLWIFRKIGPPMEVAELLAHVNSVGEETVIYAYGQFEFEMLQGRNHQRHRPMIFPTAQERAAFGAGLAHGISVMGGSTTFMNQEQKEAFEEIDARATVRADPTKMN
jgi:hypothetical protein